MSKSKMLNRVWLAAAGVLVAASCAVPAWAEAAPIDDASGPRTAGAEPEDASGPPGPSFDEPVSIPGVGEKPTHPGDDATEEELEAHAAAMREYRAQVNARDRAIASEYARQAAKAYKECVAAGRELC